MDSFCQSSESGQQLTNSSSDPPPNKLDMSQEEQTPLLKPNTSITNRHEFPPVCPQGENQPSPYQAVEISPQIPSPSPDNQSSQNGIVSCPLVALIALIVGLVLIFGVIVVLPGGDKEPTIRSELKQSEGAPNSGAGGFKDITIPQGRLRGFTKMSRQGRDYTAYFKVPYAEPPVGDLRFKDPIAPRTNWQGLRSNPVVAPECIHKEKYAKVPNAVGFEDCLYANIYVPSILQPEPPSLPVLVYIHGGGFFDGNGSRYGPNYFMDEDVILITFQYRLGPFGFLNTQDDLIHGNMGFKDQVQMLQWTKDNIQHFGGDPDRVTIFGNSAGAMSVGFLMASPMAKGLFHGAITMSGASLCAVTAGGLLDMDPIRTVHEVGRVVNCDSGNSTSFLECLQAKDAAEIALVKSEETVYGLTIENRSDDDDDAQIFMPDTPYNILKNNPNPVPYIIGVVKSESAHLGLGIVMDPEQCRKLNTDFVGTARDLLDVDMSEEELRSVQDFYFGDKLIGNESVIEVIDMMSDRGIIHCSYLSAKMHSEFSPVYLYYLSKPSAKSYAQKTVPGYPAKEMGIVSHADELQYFFLYQGYPEIVNGDPDYFEFSSYLVHQWATFAANGMPSSDWEPIGKSSSSSSSPFWFELNDKTGRTDALRDRMEFWDRFTHAQLKYT